MQEQIPLGKIIKGEATRDAVHIAIAPVEAYEEIEPGDHLVFVNKDNTELVKVTYDKDEVIGVADPYLSNTIRRKQRFFMLLMPNTVTSLKHDWTHPAFKVDAEEVLVGLNKMNNHGSVQWLTEFASDVSMDYKELVAACSNYLATGEDHCLSFDTPDEVYANRKQLWYHYEIATGLKVPEEKKEDSFFRCACYKKQVVKVCSLCGKQYTTDVLDCWGWCSLKCIMTYNSKSELNDLNRLVNEVVDKEKQCPM